MTDPTDMPSNGQAPLAYDIVDAGTLSTAIVDAATARIISGGRYATREDVLADYDRFDLAGAIHHGWPITDRVLADVSIVEFDNENTEIEDFGAPGFEGLNTIGDLTFVGVQAGGDWEAPVVLILYLFEGQLRGYVPDGGNHYDRSTMKAFGNADTEADQDAMEAAEDGGWDVEALRSDIVHRFGLAI